MKLFAVIGNPVSHSRSPLIHNSAFSVCGIGREYCYTRLHLDDGKNLKEALCKYRLDGANITVPFKEDAYNICDELDEYATNIGSVNTIIQKNNRFFGKNTDAPGFLKAIADFGDIKNAVILGAGGTTRAVSYALKQSGIDFIIVNRSPKRLEFFENRGYKTALFENYTVKECDLLINTTSAGLSSDELPCDIDLFDKIVAASRFGFDVVYGKKTPFIRAFMDVSKPVKDGSDMLLFQAFFAYKSFYDTDFDDDEVLSAMRKSFEL